MKNKNFPLENHLVEGGWRKIVSPKTSSLAYDEIGEESVSLIDREFTPELNLIISKRAHLHRDVSSSELITSIRGSITVSF